MRLPSTSRALHFERARRQDAESIVELVHGAYRGENSRLGWTTEADLLDGQRTDVGEVRALIAGPDTRLILAREGAVLLGCVLLESTRENFAYVGMLAVRPTLQGRGVGRALLAEVERVARRERLGACLRMTVIAQRPELLAWYARRGYHPTGERVRFPYGDERFGLPRRPDLYFAVLEKPLVRVARGG